MLQNVHPDLRVEAIRMMRVIRHSGPDYRLQKEFLHGDIHEVMESGLFSYSIEEGYQISVEGMKVLEMFDPKPRS